VCIHKNIYFSCDTWWVSIKKSLNFYFSCDNWWVSSIHLDVMGKKQPSLLQGAILLDKVLPRYTRDFVLVLYKSRTSPMLNHKIMEMFL
jgi:hypothetical protein